MSIIISCICVIFGDVVYICIIVCCVCIVIVIGIISNVCVIVGFSIISVSIYVSIVCNIFSVCVVSASVIDICITVIICVIVLCAVIINRHNRIRLLNGINSPHTPPINLPHPLIPYIQSNNLNTIILPNKFNLDKLTPINIYNNLSLQHTLVYLLISLSNEVYCLDKLLVFLGLDEDEFLLGVWLGCGCACGVFCVYCQVLVYLGGWGLGLAVLAFFS
jgi:hypothetical protein